MEMGTVIPILYLGNSRIQGVCGKIEDLEEGKVNSKALRGNAQKGMA